jgi:hypothetical protein
MVNTTLPTDSNERKEYSIGRGFLAYFPAAVAGAARHSFKAGAKHTQGELVHHRWKSTDTDDCIERHAMDIRDLEAAHERLPGPDSGVGGRHDEIAGKILEEANALVWRAAEWSQRLHEKYGGAPLAPAARLEPPQKLLKCCRKTPCEHPGQGVCTMPATPRGFVKADWLCDRTEACNRPKGHGGDCYPT